MTRRAAKAQAQPPAAEEVDIEALLREADAADAAARATLPTAEQERAIIAAAEALAGSEEGVPAKSRAVVQPLVTKWLDFLEKHGNEYGYSIPNPALWQCARASGPRGGTPIGGAHPARGGDTGTPRWHTDCDSLRDSGQ
jgi:hypothetical protein